MKYTNEEIKSYFNRHDVELCEEINELSINSNTKIKFICNKHKDIGIQSATYQAARKNTNICKECIKQGSYRDIPHILPKYINNHYDEVLDKYKNKLSNEPDGNEYELCNVYTNNNRTILDLLHKKCNIHYYTEQNKFFKSHCRCQNPSCKFERKSLSRKKPLEVLKNEIYELVNDDYILVDDCYNGTNDYVNMKHNIDECGHIFKITPHNFLAGNRCPKCAMDVRKNKLKLSDDEIYNRLSAKWNMNEYEILSDYINSSTPLKILHKTCKHVSHISFTHAIDRLSLCTYCTAPSRGEKKIIDFLDSYMFENYEYQKTYDGLIGIGGGLLSYDFYLPNDNLLIEYQGEYHDGTVNNQTDKDFERQKEHDLRKREYAKEHNIELLEIWYWDFDNIEKILKEKLKIEDENNIMHEQSA